ncbi:MAG: hypothetical protein JRE23_07670 [Deltaproteobacteria bacterium]|nr:hypothetical protein [Deltaproteobacteria bacterium]MBW2646039.1 hypothetical protein [Deltaproteobacteria bacterium]
MKYTFPLFKFLKNDHTQTLLNYGQIRVGTLFEFRDSEKYSGLIYDNGEGQKQISVYFNRVELTGNELAAFGIPIGGEGKVNLYGSTIGLRQDSPDCYIYPTTSSFFSSTLIQAVDDGKESCVMIKNPEQFFNVLTQNFNKGTYIGIFPCLYGDRQLNLDWDKHKEYIKVLSSVPASIVKPSKHIVYREVRTLWLKNSDRIKPEIFNVPELINFVTEVRFEDLDLTAIRNDSKQKRIGVEVIKKPGMKNAEFSIEMPNEVFTPVIFESEGKNVIGFKAESNTTEYKGPTVSNADIGVAMTDVGPLFCVNYIDDIVQFRYFSQVTS